MDIDRRTLLTSAGAGALGGATLLAAAPAAAQKTATSTVPKSLSALGIDAAHLGVRADSSDDQSRVLQRAIDTAAAARAPLALAPGTYIAAGLSLPAGAQLVGVRGATRLRLGQGPSLIAALHADRVGLAGITLDGTNRPLSDESGLLSITDAKEVRIADCAIIASGGHGIRLESVAGEVAGTSVLAAAGTALISYNARGLLIARNVVREAGNNGIQILRWETGDDGTIVVDNRIEDVADRAGGTGQYGNGINAYQANNVIVRGNRIARCAFSAVRGNTASNLQIVGNTCTDLGEVALYSEFGFEGAVIANNVVERAAHGVSIANFKDGGRLAVVQGNVIRNLTAELPPRIEAEALGGVGIYVEADSAVTGNVIDGASGVGILAGWHRYLRDVSVTGNVVRKARIGIGVSVADGAGATLVSDNLVSGARDGAVVGMSGKNPVTGDLTKGGAARYAHLTLRGNTVN